MKKIIINILAGFFLIFLAVDTYLGITDGSDPTYLFVIIFGIWGSIHLLIGICFAIENFIKSKKGD